MEKNWNYDSFVDEHVDAGYSDDEIRTMWGEYQSRLKPSVADTAKTKGSATDKTATPGSKSGVRSANFVQRIMPSEFDNQFKADLELWKKDKEAGKAKDFDNWVEDKYGKSTGKSGSNAVVRAYRDYVIPAVTKGTAMGRALSSIEDFIPGLGEERQLARYRSIRAPKADVGVAETLRAMKDNPMQVLGAIPDMLTDPRNLPENLAIGGLGAGARAGAGAFLTGKGFAMTEAAAKAAQLAGKTGFKVSSAARAIPYAAGSTVEAGTGGLAGAFQSGEFNADDALAGAATGLVMGEAPGLALRAGKAAKAKFGKPAARKADITDNFVRFNDAGGTNYADYWDPKDIEKRATTGFKFNPAEIQEIEAIAAQHPELKARLDQLKADAAPVIEAGAASGMDAAALQNLPYNKLFKEMHGAKVADVQAKADAATGPKPEKKMTQAQVDDLKAKYPGPELAGEDPMTIIANMGGPKAASVLHRKILKAKEQGFDVNVDERLSDLESLAGVMKSRSEMAAEAAKSITQKQKVLDDPKQPKAVKDRIRQEIADLEAKRDAAAADQAEFEQAKADSDLSTKVYGHSFATDFEDRLLKMKPEELARTMDLARRGELPEAEAALADAFAGYDTEYKAIQSVMSGNATPATKDAAVRTILETISAKKKAEADLKARGASMDQRTREQGYKGQFDEIATGAEADAATRQRAEKMDRKTYQDTYAGLLDERDATTGAEGVQASRESAGAANTDLTPGTDAAKEAQRLADQDAHNARLQESQRQFLLDPKTKPETVEKHIQEVLDKNPALGVEIGVSETDAFVAQHGTTEAARNAAKAHIKGRVKEAVEKIRKTGEIPKSFI